MPPAVLLLRLETLAASDPLRSLGCLLCGEPGGPLSAYTTVLALPTAEPDQPRHTPVLIHALCAGQPWAATLPEVEQPLPHGLIGKINDLVALYGVFAILESMRFILQYPDPDGPTATSKVSAERSLARELLNALQSRAWTLVARKKIPRGQES